MSNTFNFNRFWNYFCHDLNTAKNDSGLTVAILGATPVFVYFIIEAFALLFNGHAVPIASPKIMAIVIALVIAGVAFPARHYGILTEKGAGSNWLMLPASRLEKWLSMLLMTCLVLPVVLLVELVATDGLMSLIFNGTYGPAGFGLIASGFSKVWQEFSIEGVGRLAISWPYSLYISWCANVLVFTIGAICFKKSKVGMTFLSYFLVTMVLSFISIAIMKAIGLNSFNIGPEDINEASMMRIINVVIYLLNFLTFLILDGAIFLRIKNLKH